MTTNNSSARNQRDLDIEDVDAHAFVSMSNLHYVLTKINEGSFVINDDIDDVEAWGLYRMLCRIRFELDRAFRDTGNPRLSEPAFLSDFPLEPTPQKPMA